MSNIAVSENDAVAQFKPDSARQAAYMSKLISSQTRINMMPKMPVTLVNLNPYELMVLHPLFSGMKVNARREGDQYSALVIRDVRYEVNTGIDHNWSPEEYWPVQLASEFCTQYAQKGGVFKINGDLEQNPEIALTKEFKKLELDAEAQLIIYARQMKRVGDNEWNTPSHQGVKNILPVHRMMAKFLYSKRLIKGLPDWMDDAVEMHALVPVCPSCKIEPKAGATICGNCSRVLDPAMALKNGDIDENHLCLERLTRAQVVELGISNYVAETSDEVGNRRTSGAPKPVSKFEIQQQKELDKQKSKAA